MADTICFCENIINFKADFYPGRHRSFTGMPHNYLFMERENIDEAIAPVYGASIGESNLYCFIWKCHCCPLQR
ncbi:hypothetical protein DWUX_654 [Desulfovibrio diazotrophicus]|nr:hypothetical protein DWUX_654 [Desulfovibrio diazotrophicus]VVU42658.1 hypothetical protein DWUX_4 [Desulfovibrio diazotrophicus]